MIPSNSISLNSPAGDLRRAFSKDAELIGFLQSSDYCYCLLVDGIPFYVFHQMNGTFVTRILYGTPFRSEAERQSAAAVCAVSKEGRLDEYLLAAKEAARDCGVKVCDCYARWQKMRAAGVDTTALLCNHINHPSREMHDLFAVSLLETIFEE